MACGGDPVFIENRTSTPVRAGEAKKWRSPHRDLRKATQKIIITATKAQVVTF